MPLPQAPLTRGPSGPSSSTFRPAAESREGLAEAALRAGLRGARRHGLALWAACLGHLAEALGDLVPAQREAFLRHHRDGAAAVAAAAGRTPHAVEQALVRARRRLAGLLAAAGWDEPELRALAGRAAGAGRIATPAAHLPANDPGAA